MTVFILITKLNAYIYLCDRLLSDMANSFFPETLILEADVKELHTEQYVFSIIRYLYIYMFVDLKASNKAIYPENISLSSILHHSLEN